MKFNDILTYCVLLTLSMFITGCSRVVSTDDAPTETSSAPSETGDPSVEESTKDEDENALGEEIAPGEDAPAFPEFPFPEVPQASARDTIEMSLLTDDIESATFGAISRRLETSIRRVGYPKIGYYTIPNGFALTTYLEQIDAEGSPRKPRFSREVAPRETSGFIDNFLSLFTADPGYWRVIVFLITDRPFHESGVPPTEEEAHDWPSHGAPSLSSLEHEPITPDHKCTVFIYEFQKRDRNSDPEPASLGISTKMHLYKAQILDENGQLPGID